MWRSKQCTENEADENTKRFPHGSAHFWDCSEPAARVGVTKPTEIECMSTNDDHLCLVGSRACMALYRAAPLLSDLGAGFDSFSEKIAEGKGSLFDQYVLNGSVSFTHLLSSLKGKYDGLDSTKPHFVTWRGNLTNLMRHPYAPRDAMLFGVWRHGATIYISTRDTEEKLRNERSIGCQNDRFMYYGYKFEECNTRKEDGKEEPVNMNISFRSVFQTRIGEHRVVASGVVDCVDPVVAETNPTNDSYVQLKLTGQQTNDHQISRFEQHKLLKWYCQSFIIGVPRIIAGFRDDQGILRSTHTFNTTEIPGMLRAKYSPAPPPWDHNRLVSFLDQVLSWLRVEVVEQDVMYELSYDGRKGSALQLAPTERLPSEEVSPELYL